MSWQTTRRVEFQHCDPAGMVFYPRYFEMINSVIEAYFREHLGWSFAPMHTIDRRGIPTATIKVDFHTPGLLDDLLVMNLHTDRVGSSSATFTITCTCGDEKRFTSTSTIVQTSLETRRATPWPDHIRKLMQET